MKIYRINASQGNVPFTQSVKADSYKHAREKFEIENNKNTNSFCTFPDDKATIDKITRRY